VGAGRIVARSPAAILGLQRTAGNRATSQLVARSARRADPRVLMRDDVDSSGSVGTLGPGAAGTQDPADPSVTTLQGGSAAAPTPVIECIRNPIDAGADTNRRVDGPGEGDHTGDRDANWFNSCGHDIYCSPNSVVHAAFTGNVTPAGDNSDAAKARTCGASPNYGGEIFVLSDDGKLGAFYKHFFDGNKGTTAASPVKLYQQFPKQPDVQSGDCPT
jgi:hypothetical protein